MMFEYYLNNLASHQFIVDSIAAHGFDNLAALVAELKRRKGGRR